MNKIEDSIGKRKREKKRKTIGIHHDNFELVFTIYLILQRTLFLSWYTYVHCASYISNRTFLDRNIEKFLYRTIFVIPRLKWKLWVVPVTVQFRKWSGTLYRLFLANRRNPWPVDDTNFLGVSIALTGPTNKTAVVFSRTAEPKWTGNGGVLGHLCFDLAMWNVFLVRMCV